MTGPYVFQGEHERNVAMQQDDNTDQNETAKQIRHDDTSLVHEGQLDIADSRVS